MVQSRIVFDTKIIAKPIDNDRLHDESPGFGVEGRERRQRSEQYLTLSHTFSHFLRQQNGKPQITQILLGRLDCLRIFIGG